MTRQDTLAERVARAQREINGWNSRTTASMQLQGDGSAARRLEPQSDRHNESRPQRTEDTLKTKI